MIDPWTGSSSPSPVSLRSSSSTSSPSCSGPTPEGAGSAGDTRDIQFQYWRRYYGPTLKAFEAVGDAGRDALEADLLDLIGRFNRADDGTMVVPSEYLESVIVKR